MRMEADADPGSISTLQYMRIHMTGQEKLNRRVEEMGFHIFYFVSFWESFQYDKFFLTFQSRQDIFGTQSLRIPTYKYIQHLNILNDRGMSAHAPTEHLKVATVGFTSEQNSTCTVCSL